MRNYNDVLNQLQDFGLRPDTPLKFGDIVRCKVEGEREKKGWYVIHKLSVSGGDIVLVGTYGIWHGTDDNRQKIKLDKRDELSDEQKKAFAKKIADDRKKAAAQRKKQAEYAAQKAQEAWDNASEIGEHEYLVRKNIQTHGARFANDGDLLIPMLDGNGKIHGLQRIRVLEKNKGKMESNGI